MRWGTAALSLTHSEAIEREQGQAEFSTKRERRREVALRSRHSDSASSTIALGSTVAVHIAVPLITILERVGVGSPASIPGEAYRDLGNGVREVRVEGATAFDVNVPVDSRAKAVNVNQVPPQLRGVQASSVLKAEGPGVR